MTTQWIMIQVLNFGKKQKLPNGLDTSSPSAMMDGQVAAIRKALDDEGFSNVSIMSHAAKHRSNFYSPLEMQPDVLQNLEIERYQMPYTNTREAMMEVEMDINEGADIVMIKPVLSYRI